jgi:glutamate-ammonia-ligase adenylyltransferase
MAGRGKRFEVPVSEGIIRPGRNETILSLFPATEREVLLRDAETMKAVSALAGYSPALTYALAARPDLVRWLFLDKSFEEPAHINHLSSGLAAGLRGVTDLEGLQKVLRLFRLREISRLAVRDLTGRAPLSEVMETLSALADACLQQSLSTAMNLTCRRHQLTPTTLGFQPFILGMGKLGGRELNYSSDVDLIYLYRQDSSFSKLNDGTTLANHVFTLVTRAMSEFTEDGLVFRVDTNLRPGGKDGSLAQSLEEALNHYLLRGRPWERLAMLKARTVAGDEKAGERFLAEVEPFVLRRHLDYTTLEELKELKVRFTRERSARMTRRSGTRRESPSIDVKLSPGGIREVEFFAQALTLTFGGRLPHLRHRATLATLKALADEGIISGEDARVLSEAYVFLRTVEHRVQLRDMTQTQSLPRQPEAQEALAASLGFTVNPWSEFMDCLERHLAPVRQRYDLLLAEPGQGPRVSSDGPPEWSQTLFDLLDDRTASQELLAAAGFKRPDAAWCVCRNIKEGRFIPLPLSRYTQHLERLFPWLVSGMAGSQDPDRAILHLERFLVGIGPKAGFLVLLEEHPNLIDLLSTLLGTSDYLAEILIQHPAILDSLVDRRSALLVKDRATMMVDLDTMLCRDDDPEAMLTIMRRFKNDETLRIGLYDIMGRLTLEQVQSQLTDLAEVVMERTLGVAARLVLKGRDPGLPLPIAVMGLGKLGGRELSYASDLDLIFVLGRPERGLPEIRVEDAVRLSQRFISYLAMHLEAGPGYEIDSRLRPSGGQGPLVVTTDSFKRYHETSQLWERQALIKLRRVLGPKGLCGRVKALANAAIFERDLPENAAEKIDHLRRRMAKERGRIKPGVWNLKFSPGGMVDVEFVTQYLQLVHGRTVRGALRSTGTKKALLALAARGLGPPELKQMVPAYDLLTRASTRLGLIYARTGDRAAFTEAETAAVGLPEAGENPVKVIRAGMDVVRSVYAMVFGREVQDAC